MKTQYNVFLYSQLDWAFGSINAGLAKYLFPEGFNIQLFDWHKSYLLSDLLNSFNYYDIILSCCDGSATLLKNQEYLLQELKFVCIIHSYRDVFWIKERHSENMKQNIQYVVLCPWIEKTLKEEVPDIQKISFAPLGIDTSIYSRIKPSEKLNTLGYAGARDDIQGKSRNAKGTCPNGFPGAKKRSDMAFDIAKATNLGLNCATADYDKRDIYRHYTLMAGWYETVDSICVTSLQEGAGLPALEAAAAGRFVISTDVGHFEWHSQNKGGIMLPTDREEYIQEATKILKYFKNNPSSFSKSCKSIQQHALKNYSWDAVKHYWIDLLKL